jgi:hypothetical protein
MPVEAALEVAAIARHGKVCGKDDGVAENEAIDTSDWR